MGLGGLGRRASGQGERGWEGVGLRGASGPTGGQQKVSFSGSKWVYCFFTLSEGATATDRGGGEAGEAATLVLLRLMGNISRPLWPSPKPPPASAAPTGPINPALFFLLLAVIPTIIAQRIGRGRARMVFRLISGFLRTCLTELSFDRDMRREIVFSGRRSATRRFKSGPCHWPQSG